MKRLFIAIALFATVSTATFAAPGKGNMNTNNRKKAMTELNLTDAQNTQIENLNKEFSQKMDALRADTSTTPEAKKAKKQELRKERNTKMQALLTPEQQAKFKEMKEKRAQNKKGGHKGAMRGLELTEAQKTQVAGLSKDMSKEDRKKAMDAILTPEQKAKMEANRKQLADGRKEKKGMHGKRQSPMQGLDLTEAQKTQIAQIKKESGENRRKAIEAVLTPEQKAKMEANRKQFADGKKGNNKQKKCTNKPCTEKAS